MTSWTRLVSFSLLLSGLMLGFAGSPVWGASNFIRVPLGKGASIEVPKNWTVLSGNQRATLDSFVEAKGFRQTESTLSFVANLYDNRGKAIASVNARFYPENQLTQADARQATPVDLKEFDVGLRKGIETPLKAAGQKLLNWYGSTMQVINGLHVVVHEHQRSEPDDAGVRRSRGLRVWNSPRSFTVTLSYLERDAALLLPIIDYMTKSLRQE